MQVRWSSTTNEDLKDEEEREPGISALLGQQFLSSGPCTSCTCARSPNRPANCRITQRRRERRVVMAAAAMAYHFRSHTWRRCLHPTLPPLAHAWKRSNETVWLLFDVDETKTHALKFLWPGIQSGHPPPPKSDVLVLLDTAAIL